MTGKQRTQKTHDWRWEIERKQMNRLRVRGKYRHKYTGMIINSNTGGQAGKRQKQDVESHNKAHENGSLTDNLL